MVSGKNSKAVRNARAAVVSHRSTPWGMIAAILVVVLFAGAIFGYYVVQNNAKQAKVDALAAFTPSATDKDPSTKIPGVITATYTGGQHVQPNQEVAYTHSPPFGGTHDGFWAACNGVVYPTAVRSENMVHALEHGSVWIAYNPDRITGAAVQTLAAKVQGQPYTLMSPYPGLDQPISLQSWGHQLKLSDVNDPRIDQFIQALRTNQYAYPEVGASCQALGPGQFDQDNPPPFKPAPPVSAINNTTVMPEIIAGAATGAVPDAGTGAGSTPATGTGTGG
ncbi:DUF3105 domain-containing protein [Pseudonocardia sp.]|jgi:hypothetical protein|uniref:DUF3105 domain-containing protein n=1 Tax=Pseudonocardia sp. TaxID=60912 RepID=UPI002637F460|nr:DUF3105 domain-containing protein [Pseudonocardia sp.]MCW2717543.1 hypothetical protein [Pseudonocardia sp.]MDT7613989.1 hypothetical protein [Pseudonocardiales bacterium]